MKILFGSKELVDEDWNKESWGNLEAEIEFLNKTGLLSAPRRILEVGSGKGLMLRYLVENGHQAVGLELDPAAIAECDEGLEIHQSDATTLPFEDGSFDIVISFDVFEHILESDRHLTEVRRVLRSGGSYLLQTPNKWTNFPFEMLRFSRKYGIRHMFDFLKPPEHCALHSYRQIKKRFQQNGFTVDFFDIPVVNQFFRDKVNRFLGRFGLIALKLANPDKLPISLRTNFYVRASLGDER